MSTSTGNAPGRIFVSYRREETAFAAAWLFDKLASHFGRKNVFKDVDSIHPGDDFVEVITTAVGSCDVLLALIGDRWLTVTGQDGQRRLDDPDDFVRLEIEAALARSVRVIPVLVEGARMPSGDELPASLAKLARRQALELSPSRGDLDIQWLLRVLDRAITEAQDQARRETERAAARHRQQIERLQGQIRERAAAQDWDAVVVASDKMAALDPDAADPDGLASAAREQVTRRQQAEEAAARQRRQAGQLQEQIRGRPGREVEAPPSRKTETLPPRGRSTAKPRPVSPGITGLSRLRSKRTKPRPLIQYSLLGWVGFYLFCLSFGRSVGWVGWVYVHNNIALHALFIGLAVFSFAWTFIMLGRRFFAGRVVTRNSPWSTWSPSERERRVRRLFWLLPPPWVDAEPSAEPPRASVK
jgi:hypothetical protein